MRKFKIIEKVSFLPYLPYGRCSRPATNIEAMNMFACNATPLHLPVDFEDAEAFDKASVAHYRAKMRQSKALCEYSLARDVRHKCGTPVEKRAFRVITEEGLIELMLPPKGCTVADVLGSPNDGDKKGNISCGGLTHSGELQSLFAVLTSSQKEEDQKAFADLLFKSVMLGLVTPLSYALPLVPGVQIGTDKYSQNQKYNIWRQSHIYSMFRANNFLTNLDRRPGCVDFGIDGIYNSEDYEKYIAVNGHTVASLAYYALSRWYSDNPECYTFTPAEYDPNQSLKAKWLSTPAFYDAIDLAHIFNQTEHQKMQTVKGNQRTLYSVAVGLAMGRKLNYVCYHGKPGSFKWLPKRESATKSEYEQTVFQMKTDNPEMAGPVSVNYGLYFCSSCQQFEAIFERTRQRHKEKKDATFPTDKPFIGLHAIPVNDSGTFLLWCLMESSPIETEKKFCNTMVSWDIGFDHSPNTLYPLTYKGRRVFPGYTMDIGKINRALVDYLDGEKFYICCFPEQVVYYRRLFPDLPFL